jgi:hypothetical protein
MKTEVAVELLKVAAQLVETSVSNKDCHFGKAEKSLGVDVEALFLKSIVTVKKQFDDLAKS